MAPFFGSGQGNAVDAHRARPSRPGPRFDAIRGGWALFTEDPSPGRDPLDRTEIGDYATWRLWRSRSYFWAGSHEAGCGSINCARGRCRGLRPWRGVGVRVEIGRA